MSRAALADGGWLDYRVRGEGPALLLASGLGGLGSFWQPHLDDLARHFTVIIYDHRGAGRSSHDAIAYSIDQMAGDVLALLDAVGVDRAHLIGHSTGGAIGQTLALDHPQRIGRLVLSASWAGADPYVGALFGIRAEVLRRCGAETHQRLASLLLYPPEWTRDHGLPPALAAGDPDPGITLSRIEALLRFDRRADLPRLRAPTLAVCAADDAVIPAYCSEEIARLVPGARLDVLPRGGHYVPVSAAADYRERVLSFLLEA